MFGKKYILSAVLACAPLVSHAAETVYTFDSTLAVEHTGSEVLISGILVNDTVPTTVTLPWLTGGLHDRCEKVFNVVLSQPAAYTLTVATEMKTVGGIPGNPPSQQLFFTRCRAELKS
jgi:hypothetical protein